MVLLAASICTKSGKALLSRQFVEMSKTRIEGLIATFPKLLTTGKQHTFIETESVRYVYQPLDQLYVLLITTKASNILEDLETLRLFARVIPEYSCGLDEADVLNSAFQLIFAFDEIVALGYREDVNLSQIRTFMDMDSHDERIHRAMQESKEREAKEVMKQRARDLQQARIDAAKRGLTGSSTIGLGGGSVKGIGPGAFGSDDEPRVISLGDRSSEGILDTGPTRVSGSYGINSNLTISGVKRSGMQLGGKVGSERIDQFVDLLRAEGETVSDVTAVSGLNTGAATVGEPLNAPRMKTHGASAVKKEDLHIRIEEKLNAQVWRDGGLDNLEVHGTMYALIASAATSEARILVDTSKANNSSDDRTVQFQTHPCLDKKAFTSTNHLQSKPNGKPFPIGQEVSLLRWRFQTQEETALPITVNCWPNELRPGFDVNIEYELQNLKLDLHNIALHLPLPSGCQAPIVDECDGNYQVTSNRSHLIWTVPVVDSSNPTGSIHFRIDTEVSSKADNFFPAKLSFTADRSIFDIKASKVLDPKGSSIRFSQETMLYSEDYVIT